MVGCLPEAEARGDTDPPHRPQEIFVKFFTSAAFFCQNVRFHKDWHTAAIGGRHSPGRDRWAMDAVTRIGDAPKERGEAAARRP